MASFDKNHFNSSCAFPVVDSGSNEDGKNPTKEVLLEDVCKMILRDRENELELLINRHSVSKFSHARLIQSMLQETHKHTWKSAKSDIKKDDRTRRWPIVTCATRIKVRQANEDVCKMILRDRQNELEWLNDRDSVSKFSHVTRLQNPKSGKVHWDSRRHRSESAKFDMNRS